MHAIPTQTYTLTDSQLFGEQSRLKLIQGQRVVLLTLVVRQPVWANGWWWITAPFCVHVTQTQQREWASPHALWPSSQVGLRQGKGGAKPNTVTFSYTAILTDTSPRCVGAPHMSSPSGSLQLHQRLYNFHNKYLAVCQIFSYWHSTALTRWNLPYVTDNMSHVNTREIPSQWNRCWHKGLGSMWKFYWKTH